MTKNKPKGRTPSLISGSNGKPHKVDVKGRSLCARCKDSIEIGQKCFGIPKTNSRFRKVSRYCKECFDNILDKTQDDIDLLKKL